MTTKQRTGKQQKIVNIMGEKKEKGPRFGKKV